MQTISKRISIPTLRRLPSYYHILCQQSEIGIEYISSASMANLLGIDDTQVRKDIAITGYNGKPKVGFEIKDSKAHFEKFLGFNNKKRAFIIGAGNLGIALAKYQDFNKYGLEIVALFDNDPHKIGLKIGYKKVFSIFDLTNLEKEINAHMAILTVPAENAQDVADSIVNAGIKTIWNFAPINLRVPDDVLVWNQDLIASFVTLSLMLSSNKQELNKEVCTLI
ncbi:MAG: redox-sensing transcriptional repressor Rex [Candidatus Melainabacteria bacterium RIFOXYA12_FULL_32_12]|nr:MAG: redox-sensing transcriptional repressor Rex [Candidatus Melainabacteria bacterium RIFOXYA12_FULL_32_12]